MAEVTREQVEDFHAQERGFENAHAERVHEGESVVSMREWEIERLKNELAEEEAALAEAKKALSRIKREGKSRGDQEAAHG